MYGYHKAVGDAALLNGWQHYVATSPDSILRDLPARWIPCLNTGELELNFKEMSGNSKMISIISDIIILSSTITAFVRDQLYKRKNEECLTIFMERFNAMQLLSLILTIARTDRRSLSCWLLFRHEPCFFGRSRYIYRLLTLVLRSLLGPGRFKLLTDSRPLCASLVEYFKQPVDVVPIPHTYDAVKDSVPKSVDEVVMWWPGSPRLNKGWEIIKCLATVKRSELTLERPIRLVISECSEINESIEGITLQLVNNVLSDIEYKSYLVCANIILLPYDANLYRLSTSGIFTEAITAGGIPVVTEGTWMAYELKQFNLNELVVNWNDANVLNIVLSLASSSVVLEKLEKMREHYLGFHCVASYAQTIDRLHSSG